VVPVQWLKRFHLVMIGVWAFLAIPGLIWWKDAVWWVVVMSLYANLAGEFAAFQAARSEEEAPDSGDQARLERRLVELQVRAAVLGRKVDTLLQLQGARDEDTRPDLP
jgi:hypothetical protein